MFADAAKAKTIFLEAVEKHAPPEWPQFLDEACHDQPDLRERVEQLLRAHLGADSLLDSASATVGESKPSRSAGTVIGPYKLLEQIGEGGMGVVYVAEQTHPVQRKVALKLIKPGLDSRAVIARFEAERQALALMEHPHIAKVLDAGTTASGQPYFVMELVNGIPLTQYCDERRLTPRQRLELFMPVCQAVQHAHQKGIIHRDLKPSNVLVAQYDGRPVPKVIDFGVAKATGSKLTDKTVFTEFGAIVGTLEYMSPEQAERNQLDVDTRSDIYSLGVLLYELLTGTTPLDRKRLKSAALLELLRIIKEEEPPRPSTRLSTTENLPNIAANRNLEPKKLGGILRGELDWIVMKALEKDRNRRYETANGLAIDIERYLADEAVLACPPSLGYRVRKSVRRHKASLTAAAIVLLTLILGIIGTTVGLLRARSERDKVIAAQDQEKQSRAQAERNFRTARDAVDRMYTRAAEELRDRPQVEQLRRQLLEEALKFYRGFLEQKSDDPAVRREAALSQQRVADILGELGDWKTALEHDRAAVAALESLTSSFGSEVAFQDDLARAHLHAGDALFRQLQLEAGDAEMQQAIALWEPLFEKHPDDPRFLEALARAHLLIGQAWHRNYQHRGDPSTARGLDLLTQLRSRFPRHVIGSAFKSDIHNLHEARFREIPQDRTALEQLEHECRLELQAAKNVAAAHPDVPRYQYEAVHWLGRLGDVLAALDKFDELEQLGPSFLEGRQQLADRYPNVADYQKDLAWAHFHAAMFLEFRERREEALPHFRRAIQIAKDQVARHPDNLRVHIHLLGMLQACPVSELHDAHEIMDMVNRTISLSGADPNASADKALAHVDLGEYQRALDICQQMKASGQDPVMRLHAEALSLWGLGRADEARSTIRRFAEYWKSRPNPLWYQFEYRVRARGIARQMGLDLQELLVDISSPAMRLQGFRQRAQELIHRSDLPDAERVCREGLALYKGNQSTEEMRAELAALSTQLADMLVAQGRAAESVEVCAVALKDCPDVPALLVAHGRALKASRIPELALVQFSRAIELAPDDATAPWWRLDRATVLGALGRNDEAVAELTLATTLWPTLWDTWIWRGNWYRDHGAWEPALADYDHALKLNPNYVPGWHARAGVQTRLQHWAAALSDFEAALERSPENPQIQNALAWHLVTIPDVSLRNPARAVKLAQSAVKHSPKDGGAWNTLGVALYRNGDFPAAVDALTHALELLGDHQLSFNAFPLAMAHWELDQLDEAQKWFDRGVRWMAEHAPENDELLRFRSEAQTLLGAVPAPTAPSKPASTAR